jgi:endopolyphosphatase
MPKKYLSRKPDRHDIDREVPRTPKEIYELNRMMAGKMRETFGENVVIVPSIG